MSAVVVVIGVLVAVAGLGAMAGWSIGWDSGYRAGRRWSGWHVQINPPARPPVHVDAERVRSGDVAALPGRPVGAVERGAE